MMQNNLFLRRLVIVTDENKVAYDEVFHRGVNIIRGQNSSGKSTIVRFIFFALGGCYGDFTPEALKCKQVVAEVEINGNVFTLKRFLEKTDDGKVNKLAPLYLYFGSIAEYKKDQRDDKLKRYSYKTTNNQRSFSNVLFQLMGLPEFKTDSNITMHQILRLIYLDQESPLSSIFFFDPFDREIIRETVSELLMGLYDQQLSEAKLEQLAVGKKMEEVAQSIKITKEFLSDPQTQSTAFIRAQIDNLEADIHQITEQVKTLRNETEGRNTKQSLLSLKIPYEYQRIQQDIARQRSICVKLEDEIQQLKADLQDSRFFLAALQHKADAIERSIATREFFDSIHLEFCPECLTHLDDHVDEGHCRLCKSPIDNTKGRTQAMRIRLELDFQIRESKVLLEENQAALSQKETELKTHRQRLRTLQKQYDNAISHVRSTREEHIDNLIQTKGLHEGEIMQLNTLLEYAERYEQLMKELEQLKERDSELKRYINAANHKIEAEKESIKKAISRNGVYMLKNDQDRQSEFMEATDADFEVDYKQNMAYISNQHIKLSASSAFYLKMAARFALFFASLEIDSMMYPRLMFSDNMEDKGMEETRAKNFQRMIVRRLKEMPNQEYQLIFATSNIADELDTPEYTIGENYTQSNKSLKNVN